MYIRIAANGAIAFEDLDDFKRFKIVSQIPQERLDRLSSALEGLGVVEDAARVWVSAEAFSRRVPTARDAVWQKKYQSMIDASRKYGYIRDNPLAIASHIEWENPPA
jgi:hypothetical protein